MTGLCQITVMIKTNDLKSWSSESSSISVGESQSIALTGIDTFDPSCLLPFLLGRKCPVEQSERERERERERVSRHVVYIGTSGRVG